METGLPTCPTRVRKPEATARRAPCLHKLLLWYLLSLTPAQVKQRIGDTTTAISSPTGLRSMKRQIEQQGLFEPQPGYYSYKIMSSYVLFTWLCLAEAILFFVIHRALLALSGLRSPRPTTRGCLSGTMVAGDFLRRQVLSSRNSSTPGDDYLVRRLKLSD